MKTRRDAPRRALLAVVYSAGLVSAACGALLVIDARSARTTDAGAITSGLEMLVGLAAAMFGAGALFAARLAEYSTRMRPAARSDRRVSRRDEDPYQAPTN